MIKFDESSTAWCLVDDRIIFLDVIGDRYFALDDDHNHRFVANLEVCGAVPWFQPDILPRPAHWVEPQTTSRDIEIFNFHLGEVARALWVQRRVERRLRRRSFATVLQELRVILERRTCASNKLSEGAGARVRGFENARLIRTAADRCLPRSVALAICLAACGHRPHVVLGVKSAPFAAHCWVQYGADVLNDSVEEVRRYHPILVV